MQAVNMKGSIPMELKRVSISSKRQITIPQKFFSNLGFETEAECFVRNNELVIRPVRMHSGGEFAEQILEELIAQGYSGNELLNRFRIMQKQVRPAVENLLAEAQRVAASQAEYVSYEEVFCMEEDE